MDIANILKKCRKGTRLYSPIFGDCTLDHVKSGVYEGYDDAIYVNVEFACCKQYSFDSEGRFSANTNRLGECLLFPSKNDRDWVKFSREHNTIKNKKHESKN